MSNINKNYNNFKLVNFIKSHNFLMFVMTANTKVIINRKKEKRIPKLRLLNHTKTILLNSIASNFIALIKNSVILYKVDASFDSVCNFLLAVRLNQRIYSLYCFTNFVNSYSYYQSKKLLYKLFVLRLKNICSKYTIK